MRIGFVVNDLATEEPVYTTVRLALTAARMGHEAWMMGVGDLAYDPDDRLRARARCAPKRDYEDTAEYMETLQGKEGCAERITVDDLDALMLRNNPADDAVRRPWAQPAGIIFGELAMLRGVIVLNHPRSLADAINKMYFQHFPEEIRPRTLITRHAAEIREFAREQDGNIVLKPLQGSGGANVFLVRPDDAANLNQMIEAIIRDGYAVAQEYLPAAAEGDVRLFMMNGQPLKVKGKYAAFRRVNTDGDMRSNMHAGGQGVKAEITDDLLRIAEIVRPKLIQDGMFLVGLDIVGDRLMEVNVFSPGGLGSARKLEKQDFTEAIIEAIERKVQYRKYYRGNLNNLTLATL
jgi:glutathione synthase